MKNYSVQNWKYLYLLNLAYSLFQFDRTVQRGNLREVMPIVMNTWKVKADIHLWKALHQILFSVISFQNKIWDIQKKYRVTLGND